MQIAQKTRKAGFSSLDIYLNQIQRHPLLSREEECELARRARDGEDGALDRLVASNLRFVVSIAKRYAGNGVPLEDLINDGNVGLVRAAHRFDPDRGFKFISYAVWWVRQAILQSLSKNSRIVRLPFNRADDVLRIGRATRELDQELGRKPTPEEIGRHLEIPVSRVTDSIRHNTSHISLDAALSSESDENTLVDYLADTESPSPDTSLYESTLRGDMRKALDTLPDRERTIIMLYFGIEGEAQTLEQIGERLGYTRERIRQLKVQALDRLRTSSRADLLSPYMEN